MRDREYTETLEAPSFRHEMGLYSSDEEFGDLIRPFALEGIDASEAVVFAYEPRKMDLLREWLPESEHITYITDAAPYATPAKALAEWRKVVQEHLARGAKRVRIAGNVPHPGDGRSYVGWDRYEATLDTALGDLSAWAPCLYDTRITPPEVLAIAKKHHRFVLEDSGTQCANESFELARNFRDFLAPLQHDLEITTPTLELFDPTPTAFRAAISRLAEGVLAPDERDQLVLAASEIVTNALLYGKPPVRTRAWCDGERLVLHIHDQGEGPIDPLAGLLQVDQESPGGRGLWIVHQLDVDIAFLDVDDGFTVRLLV